MNYKILENGDLEISVDEKEQKELHESKREMGAAFDSDEFMIEMFEKLIANSELDWGTPESIEALTSAPILITLGEKRPLRPQETVGRGNEYAGRVYLTSTKIMVYPIEKAWGFMDYQIISVQSRLAEEGKAVFKKGYGD